MSKNDFLDRLHRIDGAHQQEQPIERRKPKRRKAPMIIAALGLGMVFYAGISIVGPDKISTAVAARMANLPFDMPKLGGAGQAEPEEAGPMRSALAEGAMAADFVFTGERGEILASPAVLTAGEPVLLSAVADGFHEDGLDTSFNDIKPLKTYDYCQFLGKAAEQKLYSVQVNTGNRHAPLTTLDRARVGHSMMRMANEVTDGKRRNFRDFTNYMADGQIGYADVFVTDTSADIFLVLQQENNAFEYRDDAGMMWNVHVAEGVTLSDIVVMGQGQVGLILPNGQKPKVQAMDRRRAAEKIKARSPEGECHASVRRKPDDKWGIWQKEAKKKKLGKGQVKLYTKAHLEYDAWFTDTFGASASDNLIEAQVAAHILVGPLPEAPVPYQNLAVQTLYLSQADHVFTGTPEARFDAWFDTHMAVLEGALGGALSNAIPATQELAQ